MKTTPTTRTITTVEPAQPSQNVSSPVRSPPPDVKTAPDAAPTENVFSPGPSSTINCFGTQPVPKDAPSEAALTSVHLARGAGPKDMSGAVSATSGRTIRSFKVELEGYRDYLQALLVPMGLVGSLGWG